MGIVLLVSSVILGIALIVLFTIVMDVHVVRGHELAVKETWQNGLVNQTFPTGTYVLVPGATQKMFNYDMGIRVFVMNDKETDPSIGRPRDSYIVQSVDQQDIHISLNVTWRLDPEKLIQIHKSFRENIEEVALRPTLLQVVKNHATLLKATDAYSGDGLVKLQSDVQKELQDPEGRLREDGIIVESFVIEGIMLDPEYTKEIKQRQVAVQRELRAVQEEKAAMAESLQAKAEAQKEYETQMVTAKTEKEKGVMRAEQEAEVQVLAAKASAEKKVIEAKAEQESAEAQAAALLAKGKAEAESKRLMLESYAVPGADAFVSIEISKNMGVAFSGIKGYLPSDMKVHLLSESFMNSVNSLMTPKLEPVPELK